MDRRALIKRGDVNGCKRVIGTICFVGQGAEGAQSFNFSLFPLKEFNAKLRGAEPSTKNRDPQLCLGGIRCAEEGGGHRQAMFMGAAFAHL